MTEDFLIIRQLWYFSHSPDVIPLWIGTLIHVVLLATRHLNPVRNAILFLVTFFTACAVARLYAGPVAEISGTYLSIYATVALPTFTILNTGIALALDRIQRPSRAVSILALGFLTSFAFLRLLHTDLLR